MFSDYLKLGFDHILDPNGYDHILFVATLCVIYGAHEWKKILWLVTAFTLGHCLTLALSSFDVLVVNPNLVEILIPITIIITAGLNIFRSYNSKEHETTSRFLYLLPLGFGLIHGLGFSNYFKAILGQSDDVLMPLFAFNIGVELGQIAIVFAVVSIGYLLINMLKINKNVWINVVSTMAILVSLYLIGQKMI